MNIRSILVISFLLAVAGSWCMVSADTSENWYETAKSLYNQSKYSEALEVLEQGLKADPGNADAWNRKGNALYKLGRYDLAVEAYDRVIEIDPKLVKAWNNKGYAFYELEKYEQAIEAYDQALLIDPDNEDSKTAREDALRELSMEDTGGDPNLTYVNRTGKKIASESADEWISKGDAFFGEGRYDEALQAYDQALLAEEDNALAQTLRNISLMGKTDPKKAWNQYVFNAILLLGKYDQAIAVCDQKLKTDPENADAWKLRGDAFFMQGMYEKALEAYDHALTINPEYEEAQSSRRIAADNVNNPTKALKDEGNVLFMFGNYMGALEKYDEALKINPYDTKGWMYKGNILSMLGRDAEAAEAYDQGMMIAPVNVSVSTDWKSIRPVSFNSYASGTGTVKNPEDHPMVAMTGGNPGNTREFAGPAAMKGQLKWQYETNNPLEFGINTPVEAGGIVYVGSRDINFTALDASTGKELGRLETIDNVFSSAAVSDDTVYVSSDMYVGAFDPATGFMRWKYDAKSTWWRDASPPVISDDTVYCYSYNGNLSALEAQTGTLKWRIPVDESFPPVVENGTVYFVNDSQNIMVLDGETGVTRWQYQHNETIEGEICLVDGIVYFVDWGSLYALDTANRSLKWGFDTSTRFYTPAIADGVAYTGCFDNNIYALDAGTGSLIWNYTAGDVGDEGKNWKAPAVAGGIVYACDDDKNLYALKADTGELVWKYEGGDNFSSSPAVFDGVIYVGCNDKYVYAIE